MVKKICKQTYEPMRMLSVVSRVLECGGIGIIVRSRLVLKIFIKLVFLGEIMIHYQDQAL